MTANYFLYRKKQLEKDLDTSLTTIETEYILENFPTWKPDELSENDKGAIVTSALEVFSHASAIENVLGLGSLSYYEYKRLSIDYTAFWNEPFEYTGNAPVINMIKNYLTHIG